jgi:hypothetical protein
MTFQTETVPDRKETLCQTVFFAFEGPVLDDVFVLGVRTDHLCQALEPTKTAGDNTVQNGVLALNGNRLSRT